MKQSCLKKQMDSDFAVMTLAFDLGKDKLARKSKAYAIFSAGS